MKTKYFLVLILVVCLCSVVSFANDQQATLDERIALLVAEDELRFDETIKNALLHTDTSFRRSAALAAGRIGDDAAVPYLVRMLNDKDVAEMAMFGIGEIESVKAIETVSAWLKKTDTSPALRGRTIEAAGKIIAANSDAEASKALAIELLNEIKQLNDVSKLDPLLSSLTLTALLRARPDGADDAASMFLRSDSARVRADAGNTLARLRSKKATEYLRGLLVTDKDAVVRANAARALGAAQDSAAKDLIYKAAVSDKDRRVRTNSISALVGFEDKTIGEKLIVRGEQLIVRNKKSGAFQNELISMASAIGRLFRGTGNRKAVAFLTKLSDEMKRLAPEVEVALVRVSPSVFADRKRIDSKDWRSHSALAAALGESTELDKVEGQAKLRDLAKTTFQIYLKAVWDGKEKTDLSFSAVLSNFAKLKTEDLDQHLRNSLLQDDVVIRATAARLLGEQPIPKTNKLANYFALRDAFENAEKDELNDAHMATLDALSKQITELRKDKTIIIDLLDPVKLAFSSPDYLIRRKAKDIADELGLKMKSKPERVSYLTKGNHRLRKPDYRRALTRKSASVEVETAKGKFKIGFYPKEAPLTVENFITLAAKGYFDGLTIHRVVPNFVMQDGDPRGDGSGGPGWHIRCEINGLRYQRGTVGMALAGKDTGGSQWFIAHSPQPHLDGGYTVFGKVNETDMKIVDILSRGDKILKVTVEEDFDDTKSK